MGFSFVISTFHYTLTPSRRDFIHPGNACMHYSYILYILIYFFHIQPPRIENVHVCTFILWLQYFFSIYIHRTYFKSGYLTKLEQLWIYYILVKARLSIFWLKIYGSAHCFYSQPCLVFTLLYDKLVEEVYLDNLSD